MLGDPDSARGGVTARRVLETLQESLPTIAEPGYTFAQDNASTHTAAIVQAWLGCWVEENRVDLVDWPPYSPDLNPIENVWKLLKESIMETHLSSQTFQRTIAPSRSSVCSGWSVEDLEEDTLNHLIESMPRRLQAVVAARGWYTKY
ncbi:DDE superfamily endonuclease [Hirsutella rhossiliensis]